MAGRKLPTKIKLIKGTEKKCRRNNAEPVPDPSRPAPPDDLSGVALAEWERLSEELYSLGLLTNLDQAALAAYCQYYADFWEAVAKLKELGPTIETEKGNLVQSPWVGIKNTAGKIMRQYLAEFGLSPSSRAGVTATPQKKANPFEAVGR